MSEALARDWITFEPELNQLKASFSTWKLLQEKIQMDEDSQGSTNYSALHNGGSIQTFGCVESLDAERFTDP